MENDRSFGDNERKETVTVTFITNHEVDPEEYDLRYTKNRSDLIYQLRKAAKPCGDPQEPAAASMTGLLNTRERIKEVKEAPEDRRYDVVLEVREDAD